MKKLLIILLLFALRSQAQTYSITYIGYYTGSADTIYTRSDNDSLYRLISGSYVSFDKSKSQRFYTINNITGLQTSLDSKAGTTDLSGYSLTSHTHTFSSLTSKPTTLSGYGITDAVANAITVNGHALSGNVSVTASDLSLGNVTNTSDANKPVSTAQQAALDLKANLASPAFTGTPTGITAAHVGLGNVTNNAQLTIANNLSDLNSASTARTNLGATTVGANLFTLANPSAIRYIKINADNSITARTSAEMLSDIGAQASGTYATGSGTASGTNTGDNAVNSLYSGLVSNATHTGDATGATAITVVAINGTNMASLGTGILKNTTSTGVPSIAVAGDFPTLNQNTTGSAATLTTSRSIYGNNFNGSAALAQIIASTFGGTGNGFTKFSGPTTAEKTFTLPDASATVLTDNSVVTVAQGGIGVGTLAVNGVLYGNTTSAVQALAVNSTATNKFLTQSSSASPAWAALVSGDIPNNAANTTGSAATLTTSRNLYGFSFNGSAATVSGTDIIASGFGGTGNGFTKFSGPATSEKTFTLPNASATILTDNALVTAAQGGTANGFFAVSGPATSTKTFTFPNASATVLTDNAVVTAAQGGTGVNNSTRTLTINTNAGTIAFSGASKTLTIANTITFTATDGSTLAIGSGGTLGSNAYTSTSYQPLATNLTSIGALANASGYLNNNGSGTFSYVTPSGSGDMILGNSQTITGGKQFTAGTFLLLANSTSAPVIQAQTSGAALSTSPSAGFIEMSSTGLWYVTHGTSERGTLDAEQFIKLTSAYTLTSQQAAQKMFNSTTNGQLTVDGTRTYFFECYFSLTSMSSSSGSFGFALGGTATYTRQAWWSTAIKAALATAGTAQITYNTAANTTLVTANTTTTGHCIIRGTIVVGTGGTIIPQVSLGVAAAAIVGNDSYFRIWPAGSNTVQSQGNWN